MEYKQAIVIRKDVDMGKGKTCTQVAHASVESFMNAPRELKEAWRSEGARKVVLKCGGLDELMELFRQANDEDLPCAMIRDAGLTQIEPGTVTCIGIGPGKSDRIDRIVGKLKLY